MASRSFLICIPPPAAPASHLADMLGNIEDTLATNSYNMAMAPAADRPATATSPAEALARFDTNADRAGTALAAATEAALAEV